MSWLFSREIGPETWGALFQSIDAFRGIIEAIYGRHGLPLDGIENLTPGTNAVFRVGDTVVKIFAPVESGFYAHDFPIEVEAQRHANAVGVASPRLLFQGEVEDRYLFRYIVMEHVKGLELEKRLGAMSLEEKRALGGQLRRITQRLNVPMVSAQIPRVTREACLQDPGWGEYPERFRADRRRRIESLAFEEYVYTHGDLTAENMIIGGDGEVCIIDFADSRMAPVFYEWPALVFGAFGCDREMMAACFGAYECAAFSERLTDGVLLHAFGAGIIRQLCAGSGAALASIVDVARLRALIEGCLEAGAGKVK